MRPCRVSWGRYYPDGVTIRWGGDTQDGQAWGCPVPLSAGQLSKTPPEPRTRPMS